jgi:CBS domain-containing protein
MSVGIYKQTAKDIMTSRVETLRAQDTIHFALMAMAENDLSAIPVVSPDGKCIGIITQRDIIAEARDKDIEDSERTPDSQNFLLNFGAVSLDELTNERVDDMMSEKVVRVHEDDAVTDIADTMLKHGIHHIPVVAEDDRLVGIISTMDILAGLRNTTGAA